MLANVDDALRILTKMQKRNHYDETLVLHVFSWAANQKKDDKYSEVLEELKNKLSDERKDYYDLVDLMNALQLLPRLKLYEIFYTNIIPDNSPYKIKVISDVDNTAIENNKIAPAKYIDHELIPGYQALLHILTKDATATTFISARPALIEKLSIRKLSQKLDRSLKYSFMSGSFIPLIEMASSKLSCGYINVQTAYDTMSQFKYNRFREMFLAYPNCKFIFFGDDTQGDGRLAKYIVENVNNSIAFIRVCKGTALLDINNVFIHRSYYEVLYKLIMMKIIEKDQIPYIINDFNYHYMRNQYDQMQVAYDLYYIGIIKDLFEHCPSVVGTPYE